MPPDENVEILEVRITNRDTAPQNVTGIAAVPIYGRSADNLRDHRNVTSIRVLRLFRRSSMLTGSRRKDS